MSSGTPSDEALLLRYQRGDRTAFALLVRRYQVRVYNFVLRQLGSALAADEVAQQVFLSVVLDSSRFNYETPLSTRLFDAACRLCRKETDKMPTPRDYRASLDSAPCSTVESYTSSGQDIEDSIGLAVNRLDDEQKDVFLLREVAGLAFAEIAAITRQSEIAVKVQMQQALAQLRVALQGFDAYGQALRS